VNEPQEYLYYFCDPPVFHVSVNSGNVVMDADFVAKVRVGREGALAAHSNAHDLKPVCSTVFFFQLSDVSVMSHDVKRATTAESFRGLLKPARYHRPHAEVVR
jgi:hypothetical protein